MTTEQNDTEIKNPAALLANNRALKAEKDALAARVSELEGQLQQAQESHAKAVEVAKAGVNEWKVRWHQEAVLKPLERDIQAAAGVPWKLTMAWSVPNGLMNTAIPPTSLRGYVTT